MAGQSRPVALVTGASRGIGRAVAVALGGAGYDLVITGRSTADSPAVNPTTGHPLPGTLRATADDVEALGARAHCVYADILDLDDVVPSFDRCLAAAGRIDVLVNNAIYVGPGNDVPFIESDTVDIVRRVHGNLVAPLLFTHAFLRHAATAGGERTIVDITSDAGQRTPESPAGRGGWSLVYAASKAGFHRIADMVALECPSVRAINVNPGLVATERVLDSGAGLEWVARHGVPPSVIGIAVVELLDDRSIASGTYVHAQPYLRERLGDEKYGELAANGRGS